MSTRGLWTASFCWVAGLGACLLLGCVNRGMHGSDPSGDDAGADHPPVADAALDRINAADLPVDGANDRGGVGGGAGGSRDAAMDLPGVGGTIGTGGRGAGGTVGTGGRGTGGTIGTGGTVGAGGSGTGGRIVDAGPPDVPRVCSALFNFEGGALYGAFINVGYQTAFSNLVNDSDTACGNGALRMNVSVTPAADKGEVIIPLAATEDLSGKTLSLAVKTTPAPPPNAIVLVFLVPSYTLATVVSPIPSAFATTTVTLPAGADSGVRSSTAIAIQVLGRGDTYSGVISIDELDVR